MDGLRQYIISVVTAAMICGIISGLFEKGSSKELVRLLCGLFLTVTAIRPISGLDFNLLIEYPSSFTLEAERAAQQGENIAQEAMADIIKTESEAYILDKAAALNTELAVDITIGDDGIPASALLSGEVSPYARQQLERLLESDFGITKENQRWTG